MQVLVTRSIRRSILKTLILIEDSGLALAGQRLEPVTFALFRGAIILKMRAFGWAAGDVGEGVELRGGACFETDYDMLPDGLAEHAP